MRVALGAALLGGVCLVANLYVDSGALAWVGLGLLGVALAVVGARLVRVGWLKVVAAAGSVALAWASVEVLCGLGTEREVEAVVGGVATMCVAIAVLRSDAAPARGNHRH